MFLLAALPGNTEYEAWDSRRRADFPKAMHTRYASYTLRGDYASDCVAHWCTGTGQCFLHEPPTDVQQTRDDARDMLARKALDGSLRSGCDLADTIRARTDSLAFLAALWDNSDKATADAVRSLGKATKIIAQGLRQNVGALTTR